MSHRWVKYGIAGLAIGAAAAAYGWKWRKNYVEQQIERAILDGVPGDVVPDPAYEVADVAEFEEIARFTCMDPCCYTPLDADEIKEYGYTGPAEWLDLDD